MRTDELQAEDVLARIVAPEDLSAGDYVAVLNETREYPSFLWLCDSYALPPHEPVRIRWRSLDNGVPLRIVDVCLPFVLIKRPCGGHQVLDTGRCQFVRLSRGYAKRAWKALSRSRAGKFCITIE